MADKTTTLKTKTNDNVYPNVIGDNRKNAFVDSSTITHHFYDQTHKVGFQINNETNIKIQNSLQKPSGLTKTELVGVGTNGQENIEIGDNLTLANGKLSATGGGSGVCVKFLTTTDFKTYTPDISSSDTNLYSYLILGSDPTNALSWLPLYKFGNTLAFNLVTISSDSSGEIVTIGGGIYTLSNGNITVDGGNYEIFTADYVYNNFQQKTYYHFITMTNSTDNIALYLTIQNTDETAFTAETLATYFAGKKVLANGNLHGVVPTYIAGEGGIIKVYYRTPGDSNINPAPDEYQDLSSFTISDLVSPVE